MTLSDTGWLVVAAVVVVGVSSIWYQHSIARAKRRNRSAACARCGNPLTVGAKSLDLDQFVKVRTCEACTAAINRNYRNSILAVVLVALVVIILALSNWL